MNDFDNINNEERNNETGAQRLYSDGTAGYKSVKEPLWYLKTRNAINYLLGVIEILLAFRFIFKLLGANPRSSFVSFIYSLTGIFTAPFTGIFNSATTNGLSAAAVFEPATFIGMTVYAICAWGLTRLIRLKALRDGD